MSAMIMVMSMAMNTIPSLLPTILSLTTMLHIILNPISLLLTFQEYLALTDSEYLKGNLIYKLSMIYYVMGK